MTRRLVSSGGPWEATAGYSRAVVVGDSCWVSGTTDAGPDGRARHPADAAGQARAAFGIIERALAEGGFSMADLVRVRVFVTDIAVHWEPVSRVMGELLAGIRPAATLVEISALVDPSLLVEIEAEARRP